MASSCGYTLRTVCWFGKSRRSPCRVDEDVIEGSSSRVCKMHARSRSIWYMRSSTRRDIRACALRFDPKSFCARFGVQSIWVRNISGGEGIRSGRSQRLDGTSGTSNTMKCEYMLTGIQKSYYLLCGVTPFSSWLSSNGKSSRLCCSRDSRLCCDDGQKAGKQKCVVLHIFVV